MFDIFPIVICAHNLGMAVLAILVSLISTTTALRLMIFGAKAKPRRGAGLLLLGGLCGGAGAWAANFVAFLAFEPGYPIGYRSSGVLIALLVLLVGGGLGVLATARSKRPWNFVLWSIVFVATLQGVEVIGLQSLIVPGSLSIAPSWLIASSLIGGALGASSLAVALRARTSTLFFIAAALMTSAICSLHFIDMAGVKFAAQSHISILDGAASRSGLALGVSVLTAMLAVVGLGIAAVQSATRKHSLNLLQAVLEAIPQGLAYFDADDRFVLGNARYNEQLAAIGLDPMVGRTYRQILEAAAPRWGPCDTTLRAAWVEERMTARTLGSTFDREMADGRFCRVQNRLVDTGGVVSVVSDISDLKQHAEQLAVARDHSEEATRAKSRFLATMSHEIRTPLNGVLGMAQAMANDTLSKPQRERLDVIQKSGESLLTVLNDVLDMSKIEAGKLEIEEIAFDLETVALTVTAAFDAVAAAKALALRLTLQPGAEGHYLGDPTRLRQILMNLVSNALKFTERGFIDIEIKPALGGLDFAVRDSGIGMTPDQCSGLFQTFSQADPSTTRKYGGTGLGLAICQELSLLMSGSLGVQSVLGQGSVFSLFLPLRPVPEESAAPRPEPQRQDQIIDLRVLAAEDNSVNQLVLTTLLGQAGVTPVIVENGVQAIEAWSLSDWDLILMDIQMPVMDGPTASREIRSREAIEGRPRTPIIALTANAMTHQVQEYLDAGMDGFVAKPIEIARLFDTIDQVLRAATEDRPGATPIENSAA